jgi:hypothetical protein
VCELLAAVRAAGLRRLLAGLALAGALLAGIAHAGGITHENVRGAVKVARSLGAECTARGEVPLYTAFLSQPPRFEHCTPYLAYARDLECVELKPQVHAGPPPPILPAKGEPGFERPVVVILRRWLDVDTPAALAMGRGQPVPEIPRLMEGRRVSRKVRVDEAMSVWLLEPAGR